MEDNKEIKRFKDTIYFDNCKITITNSNEEDTSIYVENAILKIIHRVEITHILHSSLFGSTIEVEDKRTELPTKFVINGEIK